MPALSPEEELHRLLDRFESQPEGRLFAPLADCYRRMGRLDEAYKLCVDGLARHPRYSTGFVILGRIHLDREEEVEARTAFETVLSIDPENLVALRQLALDAEARGDLERAEGRWDQVRAIDPDGSDAQEALERLRRSDAPTGESDPDDGIPSEDEAVELDPVGVDPVASDSVEADEPTPFESAEENEQPTLSAGSSPESSDEDEEQLVLEKETEAEAGTPEVLTAMSRDDSLHAESPVPFTEGGDEAETIITVTLADIYYEQGFKAKALEMYRTVLVRHPEAAKVAGLGEKVEEIEAEMDSLAKRFQATTGEVPEGELEELERSSEETTGETSQETSAEPSPDGEGPAPKGGVQAFRSWVQKRQRPGS